MVATPTKNRQTSWSSTFSFAISISMVLGAAILAALASFQPWVDPRLLFMDVMAGADASGYCCRVYYGAMSHLGVVCWCLTAGALLFAALCLWASGGDAEGRWRLLLAAGSLSLFLGLDDLQMIHEMVLPGYGMRQEYVLAAYAVAVAGYVVFQRRLLLTRRGTFLTLALFLFGLSLGIDVLVHSIESLVVMAEDGLKFVGIVSWMVFHVDFAGRSVSNRMS
jgi:hypothetical protein